MKMTLRISLHLLRVSIAPLSLLMLMTATNLKSQPLPIGDPGELGFSVQKLGILDAHFNQYVSDQKIPGVVITVARHGKIAHSSTMGFQDMESEAPIQENTIFRIASMTKIVTSVAVLKLFEEGKFLLSDPVSRYIPELANMEVLKNVALPGGDTVPAQREMTIHDLLLHTSGLGAAGSTGINREYGRVMGDPSLSLQEKVALLGTLPLVYQPGSQWRYSMATTVLGYLVEVVSEMPFDAYLDTHIFTPLGMTDTAFYVPEEKADRVISVYRVSESDGLNRVRPGLGEREMTPPNAPNGSGGLFSTVADYLRFSQMLLNGGHLDGEKILSPKTVELMTQDHLPDNINLPARFGRNYGLSGYGFGLGVRVRTDVPASQLPGSEGEYGWGGVFETYVFIDPKESLIGIYMTQVRPSSFYPLRRSFTTLVYAALEN